MATINAEASEGVVGTPAPHTPGPWAIHPVKAQIDAFATGEPLPICQLLWPTIERSEAETRANASLIEAAPDMLEALQFYLTAQPQCACTDSRCAMEGARKMARNAIAKATGTASRTEDPLRSAQRE